MPFLKRKQGNKIVVMKKGSDKILGTHDTEEQANKQLAALNAAENNSEAIKFELVDKYGEFEYGEPIRLIPEGTWYRGDRKLDITSSLLGEIEKNFKAGLPRYRVAFNLDHAEDQGKVGNILDVGYLIDGSQGPGLYATDYELSPKGLSSITDDWYDAVSAEMIWSINEGAMFQDPEDGNDYDNVLVGVALTPQPFFGHDEVALFTNKPTKEPSLRERIEKIAKEILFKEGIIDKPDDKQKEILEEVKMEEKEKFEELEAKLAEALTSLGEKETLEAELATLKEELDASKDNDKDEFVSKKDYEELRDKHDTLESEILSERLSAEVDAFESLSVDKEAYIEHMAKADSKQAEFIREQLSAADKALKKAGLMKEVGTERSKERTNTLEGKIESVLSEHFDSDPAKYMDAFERVMLEHPDLAMPRASLQASDLSAIVE